MRQLYESILSGAQLNKSVLGEAQLTESIFSVAAADKDVTYGMLLEDAIYKFFHIENRDNVPITITKSGSYYDVVVDMTASEQYKIIIDIKRSDKSGIDFKHTRVTFNTALNDCTVILRSDGSEINTHNFFTYFETDGELDIQGGSLGKDITIKSTGYEISYESSGEDDIYIKGKIMCSLLTVHNQDGGVIDLRNINKSSSIRELYIAVNVLNDPGASLISHIITCDPNKGDSYSVLADMREKDIGPQVNPEIFDTLKLPDLSIIRSKQYAVVFKLSYGKNYGFYICKKGAKPIKWVVDKTEQTDPTINAKWTVYFRI